MFIGVTSIFIKRRLFTQMYGTIIYGVSIKKKNKKKKKKKGGGGFYSRDPSPDTYPGLLSALTIVLLFGQFIKIQSFGNIAGLPALPACFNQIDFQFIFG